MNQVTSLTIYRAHLWQQDNLDAVEYDTAAKEIADIENPERVAIRRELQIRFVRHQLKCNRQCFLGWRRVLKSDPAYAARNGVAMRERLLGCLSDRAALQAALAQVQS